MCVHAEVHTCGILCDGRKGMGNGKMDTFLLTLSLLGKSFIFISLLFSFSNFLSCTFRVAPFQMFGKANKLSLSASALRSPPVKSTFYLFAFYFVYINPKAIWFFFGLPSHFYIFFGISWYRKCTKEHHPEIEMENHRKPNRNQLM